MEKNKACLGGVCRKSAATPEDLAVINQRYARALTEDQVFIRKIYLCHNAVDRDGERFSEAILADFARTLPGKALMASHWRGLDDILGRFFEAALVQEPLDAAQERTGETLILPAGVKQVTWVVGKFYIPLNISEDITQAAASIDAGLFFHTSIGFSASDRKRVRAEDNPDSILYYEYESPGEANEGSIVWLGAQPGASVSKSHNPQTNTKSQKEISMNKVKEMLGLPQDASEADVEKALAAVKDQEKAFKAQAEQAKAMAQVGQQYHTSLAKEVADLETRLGRHTSEEAKAAREKSLLSRSVEDLEADAKFLRQEVAHRFPSAPKTAAGGDGSQQQGAGGKSFHARVMEIKATGKSHYEAVKMASGEMPGAFTAHVSTHAAKN